MKIVVFGLTISSSWGNGHATLWRGLCRALAERGHKIVFFEKDVPYYAAQRDLVSPSYAKLVLYCDWIANASRARQELADADVGIVTSYCPDGVDASNLVLDSPVQLKVFYDLDTPVTLERLRKGEQLGYIGPRGLQDFDLVLSYTGGAALHQLQTQLFAKVTAPLYGSVDPTNHFCVKPVEQYRCDLSYLGTYAADRQNILETLFIAPAKELPRKKFLIGGAQYPQEFPWTDNIYFSRHVPPSEHPAFFSSSRVTLNVTRQAMAEMGYCASGRLFEAAACGTPILSDWWEGLDTFFTPGSEILTATTTGEAIGAIQLSDSELIRIAKDARERTLAQHSASVRAVEMEHILAGVFARKHQPEGG